MYLNQLEKTFDLWKREKEQIRQEGAFSSDSPFFALVLNPFSQKERVYWDRDSFPLQILESKLKEVAFKKEASPSLNLGLKKKAVF